MTRSYSPHRLRVLEMLQNAGMSGIEASVLAQRLGINHREASRCLSRLVKQELAFKEKEQGTYTRYFYKITVMQSQTKPAEPPPAVIRPVTNVVQPSKLIADSHHAFVKIDFSVGIDRVLALKRLRRLLIEEYHPLIDLVIHDYETVLKTVESEDD